MRGHLIKKKSLSTLDPHRDENDLKKGFNCVVPYGDWEGGDVVLWELGKRVETGDIDFDT